MPRSNLDEIIENSYPRVETMEFTLKEEPLKRKHFYFYKNWFVFPFSIVLHTECMEYYPPAKSLEFHFLWWHWRWIFEPNGEK